MLQFLASLWSSKNILITCSIYQVCVGYFLDGLRRVGRIPVEDIEGTQPFPNTWCCPSLRNYSHYPCRFTLIILQPFPTKNRWRVCNIEIVDLTNWFQHALRDNTICSTARDLQEKTGSAPRNFWWGQITISFFRKNV